MEALTVQLDKTLTKVRDLTGVTLAFGGPVDGEDVLLSRFNGSVVGPLSGVSLEAGFGLGGKVALTQRSMVVSDYVRTTAITHHYDPVIRAEGLRSMIATPVVVGRRSVAVVYAALRTAEVIGDRVVGTVMNEVRALEQQIAVETALEVRRAMTIEKIAEENQRLRCTLTEVRSRVRDLTREDKADRDNGLIDLARVIAEGSATGRPPSVKLTPRELDVLSLVADGASNAEIGSLLNLTTSTVKTYMKAIMAKFDVTTRLAAVRAAHRDGRLL